METLTKSIEILRDGKLSVFLKGGAKIYIAPPIVVDTLDKNERLVIHGSANVRANISTDIDTIDTIPFNGSFGELEESIRIIALRANALHNGIYDKKAEKFVLDTDFTPFDLPAANTEYLMYLFRVKAGNVKVNIKQVIASVLSTTNDNFLFRAGFNKEFDHTFIDSNFADIGDGSLLQFATPGVLSVPAEVIATGFFTGGKNTKAKYGKSGDEIESVNGIAFTFEEGNTYAICATGGSAMAKLDLAINWQEFKC